LKKNLHLIVTSDHGLERVNATNAPIYLDDYVDMSKVRAFGTKTVINVFVNAGEYSFTRSTFRRVEKADAKGTRAATEKY
jgi:sucrose-6-phosphate hydrolase SacC (GH32 family)